MSSKKTKTKTKPAPSVPKFVTETRFQDFVKVVGESITQINDQLRPQTTCEAQAPAPPETLSSKVRNEIMSTTNALFNARIKKASLEKSALVLERDIESIKVEHTACQKDETVLAAKLRNLTAVV